MRIAGGDPHLELTARRWTRQGRDRLYVSTPQGERVGWVDMVTGQAVLEKAALATEFNQAIKRWRGENGETARVIPALSLTFHPHDRTEVETAVPKLPPRMPPEGTTRRLAAIARDEAHRQQRFGRRFGRLFGHHTTAQ